MSFHTRTGRRCSSHNCRRYTMTTTAATGIRQISLVCVPTPDQDKAIEFYESIGFEKRTDTPFGGGYRWVEVYPAEGTAGIALAPPQPGTEVTPVETGITLATGDPGHALVIAEYARRVYSEFALHPWRRTASSARLGARRVHRARG